MIEQAKKKPFGFLVQWKTVKGGYLAVSTLGVRFLQRFAEWGVATVGDQKEAIVRFEAALRPVTTAGFLHLEMFNPDEARIMLLNFKVWKGWNMFLIFNLGIRPTAASQTVRAQKMREIMVAKAKKDQADRIKAQRISSQIQRQRNGHPWPARSR